MTPADLVRIMPAASLLRAAEFLPDLVKAMAEFGITTARQQAAFLANFGHETGQLVSLEENLNYSADRLTVVWPKRFPTAAAAQPYARNPRALANKVYANRGGNGDETSGDGWRFRGAGGIQLTFRNNHAVCGEHFGIPVEKVGDWLRTVAGGCRSAAWYWQQAGCNDQDDFDKACDLVNIGRKTEKVGDSIGYADRLAMFKRALAVLG